jgi:hypothetical protein
MFSLNIILIKEILNVTLSSFQLVDENTDHLGLGFFTVTLVELLISVNSYTLAGSSYAYNL